MDQAQYSTYLQNNGGLEPAHLLGRSGNSYAFKSAALQSLAAEFDTAHGPSQWLRSFDNYIDNAPHLLLSHYWVGKLVVHERVEGVAAFVGFDGTDRFVLNYTSGQRKFRADVSTIAQLSSATPKQLASAELDGALPNADEAVSTYQAGLKKKRSKLENELYLDRVEQDTATARALATVEVTYDAHDVEPVRIEDAEAGGYVSSKRHFLAISVEQLVDLSDGN